MEQREGVVVGVGSVRNRRETFHIVLILVLLVPGWGRLSNPIRTRKTGHVLFPPKRSAPSGETRRRRLRCFRCWKWFIRMWVLGRLGRPEYPSHCNSDFIPLVDRKSEKVHFLRKKFPHSSSPGSPGVPPGEIAIGAGRSPVDANLEQSTGIGIKVDAVAARRVVVLVDVAAPLT